MPSMFSSLGGLSQVTPTPFWRDVFTAGSSPAASPKGSVSSITVVMLSTLGDTVLMVTPGMTTCLITLYIYIYIYIYIYNTGESMLWLYHCNISQKSQNVLTLSKFTKTISPKRSIALAIRNSSLLHSTTGLKYLIIAVL